MQRSLACGVALLSGLTLVVAAPPPAAGELKVGVSGYIKLDIQYGDKNTGSFPSPGPADTPLDPDPRRSPGTLNRDRELDNGQTIIDARQSRVRFTFSDEIVGVKISGRIEGDFFTGEGNALVSNSRGFRLRHAFARGEHASGLFLQAGQYWSLIMNDTVAQPDLVDFNGPAGQIFARQPQLRAGYRVPLAGGELVFEADVEKHSVDLRNPNPLNSANVDEAQGSGQDVPLFTGKVSYLSKLIQVEAGGAVAQNKATLVGGRREEESAWLGQVSAQVNLGPFAVFGHYHHSDGLNRLASGDFPTAFLVGSSIVNVETDAFYVGAKYQLTKNTSVNGVFGWADSDRIPGVFDGNSLKRHQSIHVNILHKFWERWQVGLEYKRFDVDAFNGREGDVNFFNGALWYFF